MSEQQVLPLTVYTNLFTVAGRKPSENQYITMMGIWYQFLKKHGGLRKEDSILINMDKATYEFIKGTGEVDDFLKEIEITTFQPPTEVIEGMAARYALASVLQKNAPGRMYLYLDLDVLVCRPLRGLYDDVMIQNRLAYVTEEKIVSYAMDILSESYLADRISLTETQRADLSGTGGIGSGTFGWQSLDPDFSKFFTDIVDKMRTSETVYYTLDQPFFNEAVMLKKFDNEWSVYHIDSSLIGINEEIQPGNPYILMNYSGDPANGQLHSDKLIHAYETVFGSSENKNVVVGNSV